LATKELAVVSQQRTISHFPFYQGSFLYEKQHDFRSSPILLLSVSQSWIELEGRLGTIEMIEAKSQAAPNTLTEHEFLGCIRQWQKRWERCIRAEGDYFEGDGGR
jgi:hypothetical protein